MKIGDNELELLKFLQDRGQATARDLLEGFGASRGLARTTVQTMAERLCQKGFVSKLKVDGTVTYQPKQGKAATIRAAIDEFINTKLDGSIQPIASYLASSRNVSEDEIEMLKQMIRDIEEKSK